MHFGRHILFLRNRNMPIFVHFFLCRPIFITCCPFFLRAHLHPEHHARLSESSRCSRRTARSAHLSFPAQVAETAFSQLVTAHPRSSSRDARGGPFCALQTCLDAAPSWLVADGPPLCCASLMARVLLQQQPSAPA